MSEQRPVIPRRLAISLLVLAAVIGIGTAGYVVFEHYSWFDALYATVTTITTVGGGEVHPFGWPGKLWTMIVVAVGFIVFTDALIALVSYVIEGKLQDAFAERLRRRRLVKMEDHFVLCGFGRVGREIAFEFAAGKVPFVVVDVNEESLATAAERGYTVVHGNAAEIDTLLAAGIERARGLVTAVDSDADNVYVTLSARVLRPDLFIVARANAMDAEPKLRLAGANRVASPYVIGGRRLASLAQRPTAVDFVDTVLSATNTQLLLEDFTIAAGSKWIGRTIGALSGASGGALVLALKRHDVMTFQPPGDTVLAQSDELVFAGPAAAIHLIEERLS
jgi:voltage-gated potassium channel